MKMPIPPVDLNQKSVEKAALLELFVRKPLFQRLGPVLSELLWTIENPNDAGGPERPLPSYCYNIFAILKKTHFKVLGDPEKCVLRGAGKTDWAALGKMIGAGLSCLHFAEGEFETILVREKLPAADAAPLRELIEAIPLDTEGKTLWDALLASSHAANKCGVEAMAALTQAISRGVGGFVDQRGGCVGESERANVYWFLLLVWPEIHEMQRERPPISRADFNRWLSPFAQGGWVNIMDLAYLSDVCDTIGLKFKGRGAPRKNNCRTE